MTSNTSSQSLKCQNCNETSNEIQELKCGLIICNDCMSSNNKKRFKCSTCDSFHPVLQNVIANQSNESSSEFNKLIEDIENRLKQIKEDLNNGEYVIKEHCIELRRQVQLAKEIKIQQLEEMSNKLLDEIDQYEKESIEGYSKMNKSEAQSTIEQIKQNIDKLNDLKSNDVKKKKVLLEKLKEINAKTTVEQDKSKFSLFPNNEILNYKANLIPLNNIAMGCLKSKSYSLIKYDQIFRQDYSKDFFKFKSEIGCDDRETEFKIRDTKILPDNSLLVLADQSSYDPFGEGFNHDNVHLFIVNQTGRWKCHISFDTNVEDLELESLIHFAKKRIAVQYESEDENGSIIAILNDKLKQVKEVVLKNENLLIGSNDEKIFIFSSDKEKLLPLQIYNWKLECIGELGQSSSPNASFYIPKATKQLITFTENCINYWILFVLTKQKHSFNSESEIRVISESDGKLRTVFKTNNAKRISVDSKNNVLVFYWDRLVYYNYDGLFLKEVKPSNDGISDQDSDNYEDDDDEDEDNDDDVSNSGSNDNSSKNKKLDNISLNDIYSHQDYLYYFDSKKYEFAIL